MRLQRATLALVVASGAASGCCRHYICSPVASPCAPTIGQGAVVRQGEICQVPDDYGGRTIVSQNPGTRNEIGSAPPPRVVVSEPGRSRSRGWTKTEPESLATTRVEGGVAIDSMTR
ncbi:MAG: hypothetical protein SFX72_13445 [Isosphaeraceae bacterium]|nr:hypothetical protein [Isosphaeraceae bacterium]